MQRALIKEYILAPCSRASLAFFPMRASCVLALPSVGRLSRMGLAGSAIFMLIYCWESRGPSVLCCLSSRLLASFDRNIMASGPQYIDDVARWRRTT